VFIVGAARTPIGKFLGGLSTLKGSASAPSRSASMKRANVSGTQVDEVLMGHVVQGGQGQAPARQAQIKAGIDPRAGALTVNKVCGSGLKAVMLAAQAIKAGDADCIVAGGQESMSTAPHYLFSGRLGQRLGDTTLRDGVVMDGLWCSFNDCHMIELAQYTAEKAKLTRARIDEFSLKSQQKAAAAQAECRFSKEIVNVSIQQRKGDAVVISKDESVRAGHDARDLAKLAPVTKDKERRDHGRQRAGAQRRRRAPGG
jgi:acetyl-CoA C-acetyltransferase